MHEMAADEIVRGILDSIPGMILSNAKMLSPHTAAETTVIKGENSLIATSRGSMPNHGSQGQLLQFVERTIRLAPSIDNMRRSKI